MPPHPTLYLRKEVYAKAGNFRTDFGSAADYEFMVRLTRLNDLTLALRAGDSRLHGGWRDEQPVAQPSLNAHRMDCKAWRENGLSPRSLNLLLKPLRKLPRFGGTKNFVFPDWANPHSELSKFDPPAEIPREEVDFYHELPRVRLTAGAGMQSKHRLRDKLSRD